MKVESTCPCGATFKFECDDKVIESSKQAPTMFDAWREQHKNCKASPIKEFFGSPFDRNKG